MSTEQSKEQLRERILVELDRPLSRIGIAALESFLDLPGVAENWSPEKLLWDQLTMVFNEGLPFALLGNNESAKGLRERIGKSIQQGGPASLLVLRDFSEIHAGALLTYWQANVKFLPRQKNRMTPDIEAVWDEGINLDVEVTRADVRRIHQGVQKGIESLTGILMPSDTAWNIVSYVADASNNDDLEAILNSAIVLKPGEHDGKENRWFVRAVPLEQRDDVVGPNSQNLFAPGWWPLGEPGYFVNGTLIGPGGNQVVSHRSLVPLTSYINPIRYKAEKQQGRSDNPFLIAVDVFELPRAHKRLLSELDSYFPDWHHVSGVLLFEPRFYVGVEKKVWIVSLHVNPKALKPLPNQLITLLGREPISVEFNLSES